MRPSLKMAYVRRDCLSNLHNEIFMSIIWFAPISNDRIQVPIFIF